MIQRHVLGLFILTSSISANAADLAQAPTPIEVEAHTSAAVRAQSHVYGALGTGYFALETRLGAYLPHDFSIEVASETYGATEGSTFREMKLIRARKFLGNSFYIALEGGTGTVSTGLQSASDNGADVRQLAVSIGNEWILARHIVIGGEWLGLGDVAYSNLNFPPHSSDRRAYFRTCTFWLGATI